MDLQGIGFEQFGEVSASNGPQYPRSCEEIVVPQAAVGSEGDADYPVVCWPLPDIHDNTGGGGTGAGGVSNGDSLETSSHVLSGILQELWPNALPQLENLESDAAVGPASGNKTTSNSPTREMENFLRGLASDNSLPGLLSASTTTSADEQLLPSCIGPLTRTPMKELSAILASPNSLNAAFPDPLITALPGVSMDDVSNVIENQKR